MTFAHALAEPSPRPCSKREYTREELFLYGLPKLLLAYESVPKKPVRRPVAAWRDAWEGPVAVVSRSQTQLRFR